MSRGGLIPNLMHMREVILNKVTNTQPERSNDGSDDSDDSDGPSQDEDTEEYFARLQRQAEEAELTRLTVVYERELRSGRSAFAEVVEALVELNKAAAALYERNLINKARELARKEVAKTQALKQAEEAEREKAARNERRIRQNRPPVSPPRKDLGRS